MHGFFNYYYYFYFFPLLNLLLKDPVPSQIRSLFCQVKLCLLKHSVHLHNQIDLSTGNHNNRCDQITKMANRFKRAEVSTMSDLSILYCSIYLQPSFASKVTQACNKQIFNELELPALVDVLTCFFFTSANRIFQPFPEWMQ